MSSGSSGQRPGVLVLPLDLQEPVDIQVPATEPTLQSFGAAGAVQHCTSSGSSGQRPGVLVLPLDLQDPVEMHVPATEPTLQSLGAAGAVQHWISSGSSGHRPGVLVLPPALHDPVEMHVPAREPTLQSFGVAGAPLVQHWVLCETCDSLLADCGLTWISVGSLGHLPGVLWPPVD